MVGTPNLPVAGRPVLKRTAQAAAAARGGVLEAILIWWLVVPDHPIATVPDHPVVAVPDHPIAALLELGVLVVAQLWLRARTVPGMRAAAMTWTAVLALIGAVMGPAEDVTAACVLAYLIILPAGIRWIRTRHSNQPRLPGTLRAMSIAAIPGLTVLAISTLAISPAPAVTYYGLWHCQFYTESGGRVDDVVGDCHQGATISARVGSEVVLGLPCGYGVDAGTVWTGARGSANLVAVSSGAAACRAHGDRDVFFVFEVASPGRTWIAVQGYAYNVDFLAPLRFVVNIAL